MRKTFTLALLLISLTVAAQNITVTEDTIIKAGPAVASSDIAFQAWITNNTSDTLFLKWERTTDDMPGAWFTKVCDDELCHAPFVSSSQFTNPLLPNEETYIVGYITLDNTTSGSGILELAVYDPGDSANTNVQLHFRYNSWPLSVTDPSAESDMTIYPVPANDLLFIEMAPLKGDALIEIVDIAGRTVNTHVADGRTGKINMQVKDLPKGQYIIRLNDLKGERIMNRKFIKL